MNECEKVSVIVPVYNVAKYLGDCVDSILRQSHSNIEVILVNDGSTDGSAEICSAYASKDARVKVFSIENSGLSAARNVGLRVADGDWIMFVDSDDIIAPQAVETLLAFSEDMDIVSSCFKSCAEHDYINWKPLDISDIKAVVFTGHDAAVNMLYQTYEGKGVIMSAWAKIYRRSFWGDRRFREGIIYEDLDLIPRVTSEARLFAAVPIPLYGYRIRCGSILKSPFKPQRFEVIKICKRMIEDFAGDAALLAAARDRCLSAAFNILLLMGLYKVDNQDRYVECCKIVRNLRFSSLKNPRVRLRNKIGIVVSYIFGIGIFKTRLFGRLFLRR